MRFLLVLISATLALVEHLKELLTAVVAPFLLGLDPAIFASPDRAVESVLLSRLAHHPAIVTGRGPALQHVALLRLRSQPGRPSSMPLVLPRSGATQQPTERPIGCRPEGPSR